MELLKPNPEQWYSLLEVSKFTPVRSREILTMHIRNGFLKAKTKGKNQGKRYLIKGEWIAEYVEFYNHKRNKYANFAEFRDVPINQKYEKYKNPPYRARKRALVSLPASDEVPRREVVTIVDEHSGSVS